MKSISVQSSRKTEVINVTDQLAALIGDVADGLAFFSTPHTTAALILCEDDDELRDDIVKAAENLYTGIRPFKHARNSNPNAEAHLLSAMMGTGVVVGITAGKLDLGMYQNVLFVELDGPKRREIRCRVIAG